MERFLVFALLAMAACVSSAPVYEPRSDAAESFDRAKTRCLAESRRMVTYRNDRILLRQKETHDPRVFEGCMRRLGWRLRNADDPYRSHCAEAEPYRPGD